jgi:hypothetical protein
VLAHAVTMPQMHVKKKQHHSLAGDAVPRLTPKETMPSSKDLPTACPTTYSSTYTSYGSSAAARPHHPPAASSRACHQLLLTRCMKLANLLSANCLGSAISPSTGRSGMLALASLA